MIQRFGIVCVYGVFIRVLQHVTAIFAERTTSSHSLKEQGNKERNDQSCRKDTSSSKKVFLLSLFLLQFSLVLLVGEFWGEGPESTNIL
jgi:hypothetical protein